MNIRKIRMMINLLADSGIVEMELKVGEGTLRIARAPARRSAPPYSGQQMQPRQDIVPAAVTPPAVVPPSVSIATSKQGFVRESVDPLELLAREHPRENIVTAPMVGTYSSAPGPGAKPFVEIGDTVKPGQVLCTIEAISILKQVDSGWAGRVQAIMVKNGEPVEFGQPLFVVG
jgi:acetyl-CoA carboxylase biotin carboxyl carrier protein